MGVLHLPGGGPAAAVAMCHGFTGHKAEAHRLFVKAAREFARQGIAALRFDFRGSGDSAGDFREMTISREIEDAGRALDLLASRREVRPDRIGLLGLSLGGCVAACLAGRDRRVRALVLWAPSAHPERIGERLGPELGDGDLVDANGWGLGRCFFEDLPTIRPLREATAYRGPALVVHGSRDETVPPTEAIEYRSALGEGCRVHMIEGADHVFSTLGYEAEAIRVSSEFLVGALTG